MPFPFTFNLSVPGLSNPFTSSEQVPPTPVDRPGKQKQKITRRRPTPAVAQPPSPVPAPITRKRGWEPAFAAPSRSTATLASTSGYLDTPAKYRDMAAARADEFHEVDMFASEGELLRFRPLVDPTAPRVLREAPAPSVRAACNLYRSRALE
ncbi:hypothetical protein H0H81_008214 [Sphagnurus paluster]|uniref:Uncharacterized protein n=1 Tax=Sphagnurus paluster TaxID=117069 RepID=A0A9P7KGJ0_9AGAR|nr:hypothetical protein H0H81_008214 [Sphagnurus paluster]